MFRFILAVDADNFGIGANGRLAWHVPEDMAFFQETTRHAALYAGSSTFTGLPPRMRERVSPVSRATGGLRGMLVDMAKQDKACFLIGGATLLAAMMRDNRIRRHCDGGFLSRIRFAEPPHYDCFAGDFVSLLPKAAGSRILAETGGYTLWLENYVFD